MLKSLKKLFSYNEPKEPEHGFELLEGEEESKSWEQYMGDKETQGQSSNKAVNQNNQQNGQGDNLKAAQQKSGQQNGDPNVQQSEGSQQQSQGGNDGTQGDSNGLQNNSSTQADNNGNQGETSGSQNGQSNQEDIQLKVQQNLYTIMQNSQRNYDKEDAVTPWDPQKNQQQLQNISQNLNNTEQKDDKGPRIIQPISLDALIKENHKDSEKSDNSQQEKSASKTEQSQKPDKADNMGQKQGQAQKEVQVLSRKKKSPRNGAQENSENQGKEQSSGESPQKEETPVEPLVWVDPCLEKNSRYLEMLFHIPLNKDVIIRKFKIGRQIPAFVVFVDGMVEKEIIVQFTLPQLMDAHSFVDFKGGCPLDYIEENVLSVHQIERMDKFSEIVPQILGGLVVVFVEGCKECLVMESRGFEKRSVGAPVTETVVHGSQEGFTENLRTNITLVRRIVKNENLITEFFTVSKTNNYMTAMLYLFDVVNQDLLNEVKRRINSLEIDYISGNGMLEQLIEDKNMMLFPQVISTERPDRVASFLMEGKVVLICEGTPFALAMPITFFDLYHTSEETNLRWYYGSFLRIIRLFGLILATFLPGIYTALTLFHQEMIPTSLLASIVVSRKAVPFPTVLEILLMEFSFELIREGGIRVPGVTGNTLGIIGALILGQAAVEAGLVSPILIIIVAVAGLGSFAIPNYALSLAIRIIRFILIFFGCIAGFYGVSASFTVICALALGMKSFGVPFFSSVAPTTRSNKDKIIRGPLSGQNQRTDFLNPQTKQRMASHVRGWSNAEEGGKSQ
jgi:spore germination protein KA